MTEKNSTGVEAGGVRASDGRELTWWRLAVMDIYMAFGLLTRFPMPRLELCESVTLVRSVWVFPIAGAVVGIVGAVGVGVAQWLGLSALVGVVIALGLMVLCSGALHEDGLADFWDGIGGGRDREARLRIMRDSRIGSYGVLALGFCLALQGALFVSFCERDGPWPVWALFVCVGCVSRASMLLPMVLLQPARDSGLGARVTGASAGLVGVGIVIAIGVAVALLGLAGALFAVAGAFLFSGIVCVLARRYLGGQTGDVLGAACSMSTVGALFFLAVGQGLFFSQSGVLP